MTVAEIIEALGGTKAVADWVGIWTGGVRNWRHNDAIPPRLFLELQKLAKARNVTLDPSLFRETPRSIPYERKRHAETQKEPGRRASAD